MAAQVRSCKRSSREGRALVEEPVLQEAEEEAAGLEGEEGEA